MHFFQPTSPSCQKYFPELGLVENEPLPIKPIESVSRLASEIIQFAQMRNVSNDRGLGSLIGYDGFSGGVRGKRTLGFARTARLKTLQAESEAEKEEKALSEEKKAMNVKKERGRNSWNETPKFLLAGAVSTVISRTCVAPLERIKLECIVKGSKHTWLKVIKWIWVTEGLKGFWKGNMINLFRMVPFKSINFILYDMYIAHLLSVPEKKEITNHDRLVGGGISGIIPTVICLPLDTIRTRLMAQGGEALGSIGDCCFQMVKNEGFISLYKGLTPALISMGPASAVFYAVYDILKSAHLSHKQREGDDNKELGVVRTLIYGALAGACAETVTYPLEVIRRQLQLQQSARLGLISVFVNITERDGLASLYAGLFPSTLQVLPSAALSYLFYEVMKSILKIN
ncbi:uncharacterized protein A4U43_C01F23570 [Asparagus officinalis]|uniref:Mitochondrial adenine nucleotide transporter BTL3 n=1 Tax=Asparagus officinalis TaxID=4686 RepID=A0A5P1FRK7_ASPOF|nr:probable mitochondrial adenine nucleotide transporter BTL3 [Asparagus officinalis]ONK80946.1 uncharacterized protein A4U43_C01F23570 [Asparagus officinalis]